MFRRSRRDLAHWLTLCMGSILVTFAGIAYHIEVNDELGRLDRLLYRSATVMVASIRYRFSDGDWQLSLDQVPLLGNRSLTIDSGLVYARWYDDTGTLAQFLGSPLTRQLSHPVGFRTLMLEEVEHQDDSWAEAQPSRHQVASTPVRQLTLPIYRGTHLLGYLQIAKPLVSVQANLAAFRLFLSITLPAGVGFIGLASWFFGRLATRPIQQAHAQLERFTSDASHELKAPLAAILSNAQVGLLASPDAEQHYRLQTIVEITKSMNGLIEQLLVLARHSGAIAPQSLIRLNLSAWAQHWVDDHHTIADAHSVHVILDVPPQPVWVQANEALLTQAMTNLFINAVKYTLSGGRIQIRLTTPSRMALIEVEDNGVGIAAADLPHIFDRFYRVDSERSPHTGGSGLGLAIAHQIIEAHGGTITVSSTSQMGSTFQVRLPLTSKPG